jgi:hypothetical protein
MRDLATICFEIREQHRRRLFAMDQRKRADLALGGFLRRQLGWSFEATAQQNAVINERVRRLLMIGELVIGKKQPSPEADADYAAYAAVIEAAFEARAPMARVESDATKAMEKLAKELPVWSAFGEGVKGFGPRSLAVIVGDAGNLANYASVAKLWKRMGMAVLDGVRQGGLSKTASAEDWLRHGYNARRRSQMFVIGDVLVKNQGRYREIYLARKVYERELAEALSLTVAPAAKIPAKAKDQFRSEGHVHKRAQRYMEKALLRDLWCAWNRKAVVASKEDYEALELPLAA